MVLNIISGILLNFALTGGLNDQDGTKSESIELSSLTTVIIQQSQISAAEAGIIDTIHVTAGQPVSKGESLVSLDNERQKLALKAANLELTRAIMESKNMVPFKTAASEVLEAEQELSRLMKTAEISKKQAESQIALNVTENSRAAAELELNRARKSREAFPASISNAELDRLQIVFEQRVLEFRKAEEDRQLAALKAEMDSAAVAVQKHVIDRTKLLVELEEHKKLLAEGTIESAAVQRDLAAHQLSRRILVAPYAGVITSIDRQPGEWVEPGTVICTLVQMDRLRVEGFVSVQTLPADLKGSSVQIHFPQNPELAQVEGVVTFVSMEVDPVNQQVRFRADFDNPALRIRPGLPAVLRIPMPVKR